MDKPKTDQNAASEGTRESLCSTCITDFLKTHRSKDDLRVALEVLREFKACESVEEWAMIAFDAWAKLEQLEEFLDHLVNGAELEEDTKRYISRMSNSPLCVLTHIGETKGGVA